MIRPIATLTVCILWPCIARAQDQAQNQATSVYFEPLTSREFVRLNTSIREALSQPPLRLAARPGPHVLIVSVPRKVQVEHKQVSGTFYSFTVSFSRDGDSLGESAQYRNAAKLSDCTDQLVLDVKTAAAPR
jgi:hypothetical protein